MNTTIRLICCLLVSNLLTSCTTTTRKYTVAALDIPAIAQHPPQRIPRRAGFFMDERWKKLAVGGFAGPVYDPSLSAKAGWIVSVYTELPAIFEQGTGGMFSEVIPVTATETTEDFKAKNLDVIVSVGPVVCDAYCPRQGGLLAPDDVLQAKCQ